MHTAPPAILLANEIRDLDQDRAAGLRTFAVVGDIRAARRADVALAMAAHAAVALGSLLLVAPRSCSGSTVRAR